MECKHEASKEFFYIIGIDVENPSEIEEFRKDLRFSREMRTVATRGLLAATGFIVTAALALLWSYITSRN
ncbi:hypothetical protein TI05_15440 [Achromatium sp. WMS3]|nr:hypothetical protein TI05_15440 [Achromatium sp. WMS3]